MRLLIKFPSRSRPTKLLEGVAKYVDFAEDMSRTRILITLDADDITVTEELKQKLVGIHPNISLDIGFSAGKIDAINRGVPDPSTFDILLLASDDMIPEVKGYDQIIRSKMAQFYPDTDGVLFFNDGFNKHELNTILICGSKYYRRFGYLYYPEYKSLFCDNEFQIMANTLRRQKYFPEIIIRHEHPHINPSVELDELYHKNNKYFYEDEALFIKRSKMFVPKTLRMPTVKIRLGM